MADQTESTGEKPVQPGQEEGAGKKMRKPRFNMPFIVAGILIGIFAGAPLIDLGNYLFGLWGWIFGIFAVYLFSKQFKYFNAAQAGIVGLFAGIIGSVISVTTHILLSIAGFSLDRILPANLEAQISRFTTFLSTLWIPEQLRMTFSLKPLAVLQEQFREAVRMGDLNASSPVKCFVGHALFLAGLISITTILGGLIGYFLFAKPVPKKAKDMRYAQYGRPRPPIRTTTQRPPEKPPAETGPGQKGREEVEEEDS